MTYRFQKEREKVSPDDVEIKLRMDYLRTKSDHGSKTLEAFVALLGHFQKDPMVLSDVLQDAANIMRSLFRFRYVMIGLRSLDGQYRYEFMSGMRDDTWAAHKKKSYRAESFALSVPGWYRAGEISGLTRVYLEEKNPLGPGYEDSVNRPALLSSRRTSTDASLEADFLNTLMIGPRNELLGWIEYSGTVAGKLPDAMTVRSVEVIASILGAAIAAHDRRRRIV
jgi:hypothetical protein